MVPKIHLVLIAVLAMTGCHPAAEAPRETKPLPEAVDRAHEEATIQALEAKWSEMYGAKDIDGFAALLAEDSIFLGPGLDAAVGKDAVVRTNQELMASETEEGVSVSWESTSAVVAPSGEMAFDYGVATTRFADGTTAQGHYLVVWVHEDGAWKIAADIYN